MTHVEYFKLLAKNLLRDFKTQTTFIDERSSDLLYKYNPKYFDVDEVICAFDLDEESFSLMKAQHTIALMVGFGSWSDLLTSSEDEQELAKLLFENQHKIYLDDWINYIVIIEIDKKIQLDPSMKLEIFKQVFRDVDGHHSPFQDYRLNKSEAHL